MLFSHPFVVHMLTTLGWIPLAAVLAHLPKFAKHLENNDSRPECGNTRYRGRSVHGGTDVENSDH